MKEYRDLGHMFEVPYVNTNEGYYLPLIWSDETI